MSPIILDAEIIVTSTRCLDLGVEQTTYTAEWKGGDTAAISYEILEATEPYCIQQDNGLIDICGLKMRPILNAPEVGLVYVQRVDK